MANREEQPKWKRITSIEGFVRWTNKLQGSQILYRGMADFEWKVESAGFRRAKTQDGDFTLREYRDYIEELLDQARKCEHDHRSGTGISDLELLAKLQHYGAATCLIDFTANPFAALWFACKSELKKDGKVIAMRTDGVDTFKTVTYERQTGSKITDFMTEEKFWKWEPSQINSRVIAQQSVFILGKSKIVERHYEEVVIAKKHKVSITEVLGKKYGIAENTLFMDLPGFSLFNAHDQSYESRDAEGHLKAGVDAQEEGNHEKAKKHYDKIIGDN